MLPDHPGTGLSGCYRTVNVNSLMDYIMVLCLIFYMFKFSVPEFKCLADKDLLIIADILQEVSNTNRNNTFVLIHVHKL